MAPLSEASLRLARQLSFLDPPLGSGQLEQLDAYLHLLLRWNQRIRLVGPRDADTLVDEHLLDSLWVADALDRACPSRLPPQEPKAAERPQLVDVGSGAGLPGVVLAIALPGLSVTLCEPIQKRCSFLHEVRRVLGSDFVVFEHPVEKLLTQRPRGFDHAICRATFEPEVWADLGPGLLKPGGSLWFMLAKRKIVASAQTSSTSYLLPGSKERTLARWISGETSPGLPGFT